MHSALLITVLATRGLCVTPDHLDEAKLRKRELPALHLATAEKLVREPHGTFAGERVSTNFVLKWGPTWEFAANTTVQDRILQGFEDGWAGEVVRMGHPAPAGTDTYRLNVYVGNSGAPSPEIPDYAGGYATIDAEGYPMIVMHPQTLVYAAQPEYAIYVDITAVHEFFHTVQFGTGAYEDYLVAGWYWEATAVWAETAVYPDRAEARGFMGMYALLPHFPVDFFDYPDEGKLVEYHQYAAGAIPTFLDEEIGGEALIRDSWVTAGAGDDPLVKLDSLLSAHGTSLDEAFMRFAARFAAYDVTFGDYIRDTADYMAAQYPDEEARVVAELAKGTDGFVDAPAATLPGPHGYNVIRMKSPKPGDLTLEIAPEPKGSKNHEPNMHATLARVFADRVEYVDVAGKTTVKVGGEESLLLVVAAEPAIRNLDENFAYAYRMEYANDGGGSGGIGCNAGTTSASPLSLLGLLVLVALRRRAS